MGSNLLEGTLTAYHHYWRTGAGECHLIGVLPERQNDPIEERIRRELGKRGNRWRTGYEQLLFHPGRSLEKSL